MRDSFIKWGITIAVGLLIWMIPIPAGLKPQAWMLFSIFVATIVGFILQPIPMGAMAIVSLTFCGLIKVATLAELLQGFSNTTIWLIVAAFLLSRGFAKTGLGKRIAFLLIRSFGGSSLKLGFAIVASEAIFSPATPSSAARGGAILFPIVRSLASAFDSEPGPSANRIGRYLMQVGFQANSSSGALFLTAMVANPMCMAFAQQAFNIQVTWMQWAQAAVVPGFLAMIAIPIVYYWISPPELKETPEAPILAREELEKIGPMSLEEKIMCFVFVLCIVLRATSGYHKINATLVALIGASVLLITKTITWEDVLNEKGAWDTMIWIGVLITLAGLLTKVGLIAWFSKAVMGLLGGFPWLYTLIILLAIYLYSHYLFASLSAHTTALYPAMIAVAAAAGAPPMMVALVFAFFSNFCAGITHFGNGVAPIYFGAGYVSQATWWRNGFIMSLVNYGIWVGIGLVWWKFIGLW